MRKVFALVLFLSYASVPAAAQVVYTTDHGCGDCAMDNLPCQSPTDPDHAFEHASCELSNEWDQACYHRLTGPAGFHQEVRTAVCSDTRHGAVRCGNGTANPGLWLWAAHAPTSTVRHTTFNQGGILFLVYRPGETFPRIDKQCSCGSASNPGCSVVSSPSQLPECLKP